MMSLISALILSLLSWFGNLEQPDFRQVVDSYGKPAGQQCVEPLSVGTPMDEIRRFEVLVWNAQKHSEGGWLEEFMMLSEHADLILLQEASLPIDSAAEEWLWQQSLAFTMKNQRLGVATAMRKPGMKSCGFWFREPWLGTDKTALVSLIDIGRRESLLIINLHSVNFVAELQSYQQQLEPLLELIASHPGPVLLAGDFNSWSDERTAFMLHGTRQVGLQQATFSPDLRTRIFGLPIDHIFYRGMKIAQAQSFSTKNSDHGPLRIKFVLE